MNSLLNGVALLQGAASAGALERPICIPNVIAPQRPTIKADRKSNARSSSGLAISYSSLTPSVCTVTASVASLVSALTCVTPLPGSEVVSRGRLAAFLLQIQSNAGFKGVVTLSCTVPVANAVCADLPVRVKLQGSKAVAVSGILFPQNTPPGTYTVTFTGVSGSDIAKATANFTVK